jgi:hypothetical protein
MKYAYIYIYYYFLCLGGGGGETTGRAGLKGRRGELDEDDDSVGDGGERGAEATKPVGSEEERSREDSGRTCQH